MSSRPRQSLLSPEQLAFYREHDYLALPTFFDPDEVARMVAWVEEIRAWPVAEGRHLNYYEVEGTERRLSRTENFLPFHPAFDRLLRASGVFEIMEQVVGEPVVLFKEKIHYKYRDTGEYAPHQDVHAYDTSPYAFQPYHRNVTIFLDDATEANGCMELGWGYPKNTVLDHYPSGVIHEAVVERLDWRPVPMPAGSLLVMDMYWPHRSKINRSAHPRRSIFMTFNGVSKGDLRDAHYRDRASGKPKTREIKTNLVVQTLLEDR